MLLLIQPSFFSPLIREFLSQIWISQGANIGAIAIAREKPGGHTLGRLVALSTGYSHFVVHAELRGKSKQPIASARSHLIVSGNQTSVPLHSQLTA